MNVFCFHPIQEYFTYEGMSPIASEGLQILGLCLGLTAFEEAGIFIMPEQRFLRTHLKTTPFSHLLQLALELGTTTLTSGESRNIRRGGGWLWRGIIFEV